jgi:hypothetical protein
MIAYRRQCYFLRVINELTYLDGPIQHINLQEKRVPDTVSG